MTHRDSKLIIALDFEEVNKAKTFVEKLNPEKCRLKVGLELFTIGGVDLVTYFISQGYEIFLDLKFYDIPNQVAGACRAAAEIGVWMLNVHASGGLKMMQAAREAIDSVSGKKPYLIAVTILTSFSQQELNQTGFSNTMNEHVLSLADLAKTAGLDGVVCSAEEAAMLRERYGKSFCIVTPGIRPTGVPLDDQIRIVTPHDAMASGVDYMVVGRPITRAKNPIQVIDQILLDINNFAMS